LELIRARGVRYLVGTPKGRLNKLEAAARRRPPTSQALKPGAVAHDAGERMEAHTFVAFMASRLHVTLAGRFLSRPDPESARNPQSAVWDLFLATLPSSERPASNLTRQGLMTRLNDKTEWQGYYYKAERQGCYYQAERAVKYPGR
jgi:hypothetical protein